MAYNFPKMAEAAKKFKTLLDAKGVDSSIKSSRYQTEIKAVEIASATPLEELFKGLSILGKFTDLTSIEEKAISGKYKAKLFTPKTGDAFFVLNTFTEKGSLKTKDLAPEKLNLTDSKYTSLPTFDKAVMDGIKQLKVPSEIRAALNELYKNIQANKKDGDTVPFTDAAKKTMMLVKPQDRQAIGKDFGEILSLRWYVTQKFGKPTEKFYFSEISNEALVDFVVVVKQGAKSVKKDVSAKFEAGAAPSIGAIAGNIDKVYKAPTGETKIACDVLKALAGLDKTGVEKKTTTSVKILNAVRSVKLPALAKLEAIVGKNATLEMITKDIQTIAKNNKTPKARVEAFKARYKDFYTTLGKNADDASLGVVFSAPTFNKYFSLVLSPMGYALVDYMNKQKIYQEILNAVSQEMKTEQVYLNFTSTGMLFEKKLFSKAEFKFAYGANSKNSDNTGIKFSMK